MAKQGYWLVLGRNSVSLSDASTTYFWQAANSSITQARKGIPISGTITKARFTQRVGGTLGTTELSSSILTKNGASTGVTISAAIDSSVEHYTNMVSCSVAVTAGDYISISETCPTRVTNPTNVLVVCSVFIEY